MVNAVRRARAWFRYRRRLSRLRAKHLYNGCSVSPDVWERLRAEARAQRDAS